MCVLIEHMRRLRPMFSKYFLVKMELESNAILSSLHSTVPGISGDE
jgi:hypothetical protein